MGGDGPDCPMCGTAYHPANVVAARTGRTDDPTVAAAVTTPTLTAPPPPPAPPSAPAPPPAPAAFAPPAPRPDPYAQINNPLHSNWGQPPAPELQPAPSSPPPADDRRARAVRAVVALGVVVALVAVGWFAQDRVAGVVDDVADRIDASSNDSDALGTGTTREANDAFAEWEDANIEDIREMLDPIRADVASTNSDAFWQQDTAVVRPVVTKILGSLEAVLTRIGTAPDSPLKSDLTSVYFQLVGSYRSLLSGLDGGPQSDFAEAERLGLAASAELQRHLVSYGSSTELFGL